MAAIALSMWGGEVKGRVALIGLPLREVFGPGQVTPCEERVLRYVLAFSFSDGGTAPRPFHQKQELIAARLGYRRETVSRAIGALVKKGLLRVFRQRRRTSRMTITTEVVAMLLKLHRALRKLGLVAHVDQCRKQRPSWPRRLTMAQLPPPRVTETDVDWVPPVPPPRAGSLFAKVLGALRLDVTKTSPSSKASLRED